MIQRLEALRHAVGRRRDLVGVDRVQLLPRDFRVPKDQRLSAYLRAISPNALGALGSHDVFHVDAG
jgi:hypothetical protein